MVNLLGVAISIPESHFNHKIFTLAKFASVNSPCACKIKSYIFILFVYLFVCLLRL